MLEPGKLTPTGSGFRGEEQDLGIQVPDIGTTPLNIFVDGSDSSDESYYRVRVALP